MDLKKILTDKKNFPVFVIIICAVAVFIVFNAGEGKPEQSKAEEPALQIESRLERVLEKVEGAGKVSVFVFLEDYGTTNYASDSREVMKDKHTESGRTTVMQGTGSSASPVVTKVESPKVKGIIVVAEGAGNVLVKENLAAAVEASLAIMPHRIKVLEGNR